jgi:hypothetical protein
MRTRTLLTTPPGEEPVGDDTPGRLDPERYAPALALPREPRVPGRFRRLWISLTILVVVAVIGVAVFQLVTASQFQDPALSGDDPSLEAPAVDEEEEFDPTLEAPEGGEG